MPKTKTKGKKRPRPTADGNKWIEVRGSGIHGQGLFAIRKIPAETGIIEYVGEKITKDESNERGWDRYDRAQETGEAAVYLFTLNDEFDLDGDVDWNSARLINHSCDPNCEAVIDDDHIWIDCAAGDREGRRTVLQLRLRPRKLRRPSRAVAAASAASATSSARNTGRSFAKS